MSARQLREMKKKALQSYKKIPTIRQMSEAEKGKAQREADKMIQEFELE
jgi:hypothetical protein